MGVNLLKLKLLCLYVRLKWKQSWTYWGGGGVGREQGILSFSFFVLKSSSLTVQFFIDLTFKD